MDYSYAIRWSNQAISYLDEILRYLEIKWTIKESDKFKLKPGEDLELLSKFPYLGPASKSKKRL